MEQLWRLKETVVGYLSPTAKRRRTLGPGTPLNNEKEHKFLSPASEPLGKKREAAFLSRVSQKYLSPSDTKNPRKRPRSAESDLKNYDPFNYEVRYRSEGKEKYTEDCRNGGEVEAEVECSDDEEVKDEESDEVESDEENTSSPLHLADSIEVEEVQTSYELNPNDSISQSSPVDNGSGEESEDFEESELVEDLEEAFEEEIEMDEFEVEARERAEAEAKVEQYLARQAELELRKESVLEIKASGEWHPEEIYLFERLAMRSFEPLIPRSWRIDFPTLPDELFSASEVDTIINANYRPSSHAIKALQSLLNLGVRVRDNVTSGAPTERLISREVNSYIKWAERDGGYANMRYLPVLSVVTAGPNQSIASISNSITNQLNFLAEKHRAQLAIPGRRVNELGEVEIYTRQPPLLYGMIIARTIVIFVTLDSAKPDSTVRTLQHFQLKDKAMDVWNGFALAMMVIVARNYLMENKDLMEMDDPPSDPDA